MKKRLLLLSFILISIPSLGQNVTKDSISSNDKLYLKNKEVIKGKVLRVTENKVEIDPIGEKPFLAIERDKINVLIYSDNTTVVFDKKSEESDKNEKSKKNKEFNVSGIKHFKVRKTDRIFRTTPYTNTLKFHFKDENDNKLILNIKFSFKYDLYKKDVTGRWVFIMKRLVLSAEIVKKDAKHFTPLIGRDNTSKERRLMIKGSRGELLVKGDTQKKVGPYYLDYSWYSSGGAGRFKFTVNLNKIY